MLPYETYQNLHEIERSNKIKDTNRLKFTNPQKRLHLPLFFPAKTLNSYQYKMYAIKSLNLFQVESTFEVTPIISTQKTRKLSPLNLDVSMPLVALVESTLRMFYCLLSYCKIIAHKKVLQ